MAERGRGSGRGGRARGRGGPGGGPGHPSGPPTDKPKREAILDLSKYANKRLRVKFTGGREVIGTLKGYDQLLNLVMDDVEETFQEPQPYVRKLGLVVIRGPQVSVISPVDGFEEIENPFVAQE